MTALTPERIRDAAEVLDALTAEVDPFATAKHTWAALALRERADKLEREQTEQTEEAKRQKRIEQLTDEIITIFNEHGQWPDLARLLLLRYPALADPGPCDKGPCCLSNHHQGRCEL